MTIDARFIAFHRALTALEKEHGIIVDNDREVDMLAYYYGDEMVLALDVAEADFAAHPSAGDKG